MKTMAKIQLIAVALLSAQAMVSSNASAQVNCNVLPHGQARASCYGRQAEIYRQQAQAYNSIAQRQYQQHQQIGQALRFAPYVGRYAAPAWNAPRYIYDYRTRR